MDTVNINKTEDGMWNISSTIVADGNDVFRIDIDGVTTDYTFAEGDYGNRINYLRVDESDNETFGIYHLSGTETVGYVVEPPGPETATSGTNKRIPNDAYDLSTNDNNTKWRGAPIIYNDQVSANRGVKIHYGTDRSWSEACLVVSSSYSLDQNGQVKFNIGQSQSASWGINQYLGASSRDTKYINSAGKNRHRYIYQSTDRIKKAKLNVQNR